MGSGRADSACDPDQWGPLIVGPVMPAEFIAELQEVGKRLKSMHASAEGLTHLAAMIEQQLAQGADVRLLMARARLLLGYAPEDHEFLLAAGGSVSLTEAATMLGVDIAVVQAMVRRGEILAIRLFGEVRLPRLQFTIEGGKAALLHGITEIAAAAIEVAAEGWHLLQWLELPSETLGDKTPLEALRAGDVETATAAARAEV